MTNESKTLFIPLYEKAEVSREGFFGDKTAEAIIMKESDNLTLKNKIDGAKCFLNNDIILKKYVERLKGFDNIRFRFMSRFGKSFYRIYGYEI